MTHFWLWLIGSTLAPLPLVWLWKRHQAAKEARAVREWMAERRKRYGGAMTTRQVKDGKRVVIPLKRPR